MDRRAGPTQGWWGRSSAAGTSIRRFTSRHNLLRIASAVHRADLETTPLNTAAAVAFDDVTGHEFGLGGREKQRRIGDVLNLSEAAEWHGGDEFLAHARRRPQKARH